jgi:hypothetical protein
MSVGSVAGHDASSMRVQFGAWGLVWVDASLTDKVALSGQVTVTLADLTLQCTVMSGGTSDDRTSYRLVCGKGGIGKPVPAESYSDDAGVKVSTVLSDVASASGETVADIPTTRLGPHYVRRSTYASRVLNQLAPRNWYQTFDGVIHIGQRSISTYTGDGVRTEVDPGSRVTEIATDTLAGLVPGVTIDGSQPATDVEYELTAGRLVARLYFGRTTNARLEAMAEIVESLFPEIRYSGCFEFRVVLQHGERVDLQPARTGPGFGDLANVPIRPGTAGLRADVALGELVLVQFVDRDPSRPVVTNHAAADDAGWMPISIELGGPGALGIALLGDTVQAGPYAGVITAASARVKATH